jgi:hypothetical protein
MDSDILDALEAVFGNELALVSHDLGALEAAVQEKMRWLGNGLLQRLVQRQPNGYAGSSILCSCGGRKRFVDYRSRQVHTTLGWVEVRRAYYHCGTCRTSDVPYDQASGLGGEQLSPALAEACCLLAVDDSFEESARKIASLLGQDVSAKTVERLVHHVGGEVLARQDRRMEEFAERREPPVAEESPRRLYVATDGTTVHETNGWHEVKLGQIYWEDAGCRRHSYSIGRFDNSEIFGWHLWLAACRCGYRQAEEVVFLGDGAGWIRTERRRHFGRATFIVDWYHAVEHLWECGKVLFVEDAEHTEQWVKDRESWLWEGCTKRLTDDLADQIKRYRGAKREALQSLRKYILVNEEEMRYDVFRSKGYDIGSGAVEGACKHVVGKRLKQSGMIWTRQGSSTTLALRTAWLNDKWADLWASKPLAA